MDETLLNKLKAAFAIEAEEHVDSFRRALDCIPQTNESAVDPWLESTFRSMHSLKGASRAVDNKRIEALCMDAESVFAILKQKHRLPEGQEIQLWHRVIDEIEASLRVEGEGDAKSLRSLLQDIRAVQVAITKEALDAPSPAKSESVTEMKMAESQGGLDKKPDIKQSAKTAPAESSAISSNESRMRISRSRMDELMQDVEELVQIRIGNEHQADVIRSINSRLFNARNYWHRLSGLVRKMDSAIDDLPENAMLRSLLGQLEMVLNETQQRFEPIEVEIEELNTNSRLLSGNSFRIISSLQEQVRDLLLVSLADNLSLLQRTARELSEEQGKSIQLLIHGAETEVDRRILDVMRDPLLHLIRNAVDHGIEYPKARLAAGKPEKGTIVIHVDQMQSGRMRIRISDDGQGINLQELKRKIIANGIATDDELANWDESSILDSVFLSGISTSGKVTEISGRGLGMSIVREKAESIGGSARIVSSSSNGTTFLLDLPLQQAAFRGVLVQTGGEKYILPTAHVVHLMRVPREDIQLVKGQPAVTFHKITIPMRSLHDLLTGKQLPDQDHRAHEMIIIIQSGNRQIALQVDFAIAEQEVIVKPMGPQLKSVRNISGIAVLSTGDVVPIIHPAELVDSALRQGIRPEMVRSEENTNMDKVPKVMVADDSFTSRMLLKNVLEAAGYEVEVTMDGSAAFSRLRNGSFDLLVSDVDMPRMDGFVLTRRLREDRKLADLPVVLITSLASDEDRERGMDAGANAYIIKSNFDQGELLTVLERLITSR